MTHYVPFKRYFRPDGKYRMVNFPTEDAAVKAKADQIIAAGFHFEFEDLSTGTLSPTIGDDNGDWAYALTHPIEGEDGDAQTARLNANIEKMIRDFDIEDAKRKSKETEE